MKYDFSQFNPQAFQSLVQALAIKTFGAGTRVYGEGPDGAREASFNGPVSIATDGKPWNGYGVIQAKFKSNLTRTTGDTTWLLRQLESELSKFVDKSRELRAPDYYVIATNVSLSGVEGSKSPKGTQRRQAKGGKQKVDDAFKAWTQKIGLKGWLIWDESQLHSMLDSAHDITRRYECWVTPSDILAKVLKRFALSDVSKRLPVALARDLKNSRDVRRKEARQNTDQPIALHDVFVDLPAESYDFGSDYSRPSWGDDIGYVSTGNQYDGNEARERSDAKPKIVSQLMERAAGKLDPSSIELASYDGALPNRIVLLGGPGQGKSTIGQFLIQVCRARALLSLRGARMTPEVRAIANQTIARAKNENILLRGPHRFPVRIELPAFADALEKAKEFSLDCTLLSHVAANFTRSENAEITPDNLREWLEEYPWIVLLDGLDEVPPSGNRVEIIEAINEFWDEVYNPQSDVLVVVTTRQQGYGNDLDPSNWLHWNLTPLDAGDALHFAERQADVLVADSERKKSILKKLSDASRDETTAPLMVSPLQVSMLLALLEVNDNIPSDRWALFNRHYEVLRDREAAKPGKRASIIRDYRPIIDEVHKDAGFLLHLRAEQAGAADTYLSDSEFERLVELHLLGEGYDAKKINDLKLVITEIATERLVLLNSKVEGRIAFDVRSLQEFMAAARIMSGRESAIMERLRKIAARSHWRHVVRIAVSKIFGADPRHLRQDIISLCNTLDDPQAFELDATVCAGSRLALDLLADNIAVRQPALRKQLVKRALGLRKAIPEEFDDKMVRYLNDDTFALYLSEIVSGLDSDNPISERASTLKLAAALSAADHKWVRKVISDAICADAKQAVELFAASWPIHGSKEISRILENCILEAGLESFMKIRSKFGKHQVRASRHEAILITPLIKDLIERVNPSTRRLEISINSDSPGQSSSIAARFIELPRRKRPLSKKVLGRSAVWSPIIAQQDFLQSPSKSTLAQFLLHIRKENTFSESKSLPLVWPIESVLFDINSENELERFADLAAEGEFGNTKDWSDAESRWRTKGLVLDDFLSWSSGRTLSGNIAAIGAPITKSYSANSNFPENDSSFDTLLSAIEGLPIGAHKTQLVKLLAFAASVEMDVESDLDARIADAILKQENIVQLAESDAWIKTYLGCAGDAIWKNNTHVSALDEIGRTLYMQGFAMHQSPSTESIVTAFNSRPEARGLLTFVRYAILHGRERSIAQWCSTLHESAFNWKDDDGLTIKLEVSALKILAGKWKVSDKSTLLDSLLNSHEYSKSEVADVLSLASPHSEQLALPNLINEFYLRLSIEDPISARSTMNVLVRRLNSLHSSLNNETVCNDLELPSMHYT